MEFDQVLNCHYDKYKARFFQWNQLPSLVMMLLVPAIVGYITGVWWPLIVLIIGVIALWGAGVETRLLCTHCPFYAAEGRKLRCLALDGFPKFWKYRPGPMKPAEKLILGILVIFLVVLPVAFEIYGIIFTTLQHLGYPLILSIVVITLATGLTEWQFYYVIKYDFCSRCINFSCPLNKVPKEVVHAYLRAHPPMRKAWEQSGYRLDEPGGMI